MHRLSLLLLLFAKTAQDEQKGDEEGEKERGAVRSEQQAAAAAALTHSTSAGATVQCTMRDRREGERETRCRARESEEGSRRGKREEGQNLIHGRAREDSSCEKISQVEAEHLPPVKGEERGESSEGSE